MLQLVVNGLAMGCIYALVALGFLLIYQAVGALNFAQGELVMLGGFLGITLALGLKLPLPVAFLGLPFVALRPEVAGGAFYGISSALMAFGLSRHGYERLLVFLAYPYWAGLIAARGRGKAQPSAVGLGGPAGV